MVICPIALAVHCTGCPFVKFCPAKTIIGDYKAPDKNAQKIEESRPAASNEDNDKTA